MFNDQILAREVSNKLISSNREGVLIFTGAVIGKPNFYARGEMTLLKSHLRTLAGVCDYEVKEKGSSLNI